MKIIPFNSFKSKIEFSSFEEREMLKKAVSYLVPGHEYSAAFKAELWDGRKTFLTDANYLSNGLLTELFPDNPLFCSESSLTFDDIPLYVIKGETIERRQYQLDAINAIFRHKRLLIQAGTGSGKTTVAASVISKHLADNPKNNVLFVCYDKNILNQTVKNMTKKYGIDVGIYGDGHHDLTKRVTVATMQSLSRLLKPQDILSHITMVICDESQHSSSKTSRDVLTKLKNCWYYIGLTATPPKKGTLDYAELVNVIGPVMFTYSLETSTKDGNTVPVKCFIVKVPYDAETTEAIINRRNYKLIWDTGIQNNKTRNKLIKNICKALQDLLNPPTLINVDRTEHGAELYMNMHKDVKCLCMFGEDNVISREEKKKLLMTNKINSLITSVTKEGVDFPISPVVAINASGRKGFINVVQFLGRIVRKNEAFGKFRILIDFYDESHTKLEEHSNARIEAYRDTGSEVVIVSSVTELFREIVTYYKQMK